MKCAVFFPATPRSRKGSRASAIFRHAFQWAVCSARREPVCGGMSSIIMIPRPTARMRRSRSRNPTGTTGQASIPRRSMPASRISIWSPIRRQQRPLLQPAGVFATPGRQSSTGIRSQSPSIPSESWRTWWSASVPWREMSSVPHCLSGDF